MNYTVKIRLLLVFTTVLVTCTQYASYAQTPRHPFGAGIAIGDQESLSVFYAFSANVQAGITLNTPENFTLFSVGPFLRMLLPIYNSGLKPFAGLTYNIGLANADGRSRANHLSIAVGMLCSLSERIGITAQLAPLEVGVLRDSYTSPFLSWSFPNARLGVEWYF
jgi:hypothetical protein